MTGDFPLVSIITVVFNGAKSLERTIKSVISQGYPNIEYIVIDGGSSDGTVDIIKKYEDNITYWKSEPDGGISDAFNKGLSMATGDIVGFINADDWYNADTVELVVRNFEKFSVVYGDVQFWDGSKRGHRTHSNHLKLRQGMALAHPAVFVKRSMYQKYGQFNLEFKIAMDYEFIARLYFNKESFHNINSVLANMGLGGLSDRNWLKAFMEEKKVKRSYLGVIRSNFYFIKQTILFSMQRGRLWLNA